VRGVLTHPVAVVLGLVIGNVIGAGGGSDNDTSPSAESTVTETVTESASGTGAAPADPAGEESARGEASAQEASREPAAEVPGDGTFVVGKEIRPGTYRTDGPEDSVIPNCYWARLSGTSGEFDDIITNGNTDGPATVTVSASDKAFLTSGCKTWKRAE